MTTAAPGERRLAPLKRGDPSRIDALIAGDGEAARLMAREFEETRRFVPDRFMNLPTPQSVNLGSAATRVFSFLVNPERLRPLIG